MAIGALAAFWTVRRLGLPIWWLAFPPLAHAIWNGNPQTLMLALLVVGHPLTSALAVGVKLYAALPLLFHPKHLVVAGILLLVTVPLVPWPLYLEHGAGVTSHLATAWNGSAWRLPVLVLPTILALWILRRRGADWFSIPAVWPATQFYYVSSALPALVGRPLLAAAFALPVPLLVPVSSSRSPRAMSSGSRLAARLSPRQVALRRLLASPPHATSLTMSLGRFWMVLAVALPTIAALIAPMPTVDLTYHLRAGGEIIDARAIPTVDTWTFTAAGLPWLDQQWGAQVILAIVERLGGWTGLVVLRARLTASIFAASSRSACVVASRRGPRRWLTSPASSLPRLRLALATAAARPGVLRRGPVARHRPPRAPAGAVARAGHRRGVGEPARQLLPRARRPRPRLAGGSARPGRAPHQALIVAPSRPSRRA